MKVIFLLLLVVNISGNNSPYSMKKFQNTLDIAKLQAPYSAYDSRWSAKYGKFKDFQNQYFYLQDNKYVVFTMCQNDEKEHKRSELRFRDNWKVSSNLEKSLEAKIKLFPLNQKREFTILQIHADHNVKDSPVINKPLLRIAWWKQYKHQKDHLWAIIRTSGFINKQQYVKIDLGKRPLDFFNISIQVKESKITISINGKNIITKFDVNYWNKYQNYFKAGVYLQGIGCAKVLFQSLTIH